MFALKVLVAAALAYIVAAHDTPHDTSCVAPVTVTITETVCGTPGVPVHTPPVVPSYEAPSPPPASPVTSVGSTATAPLSSPPVNTATSIPPAPPADSGVPPAVPSGVVPSSGAPSSGGAPPTGIKTTTTSAPGTTTVHSSTATGPHSSSSVPSEVSTAGATLAVPTPFVGLGSLFAVGAAAMAVIA